MKRFKIKRKQLSILTTLIVLLLAVVFAQPKTQQALSFLGFNGNKPVQSNNQDGYSLVAKVVDGDTIKVEISGKEETIRMIGVDTPETVDPRKPVQCFGKEASDKTKSLLTGKKVRLVSDSTQDNKDKYGRLLRYVYLEGGSLINKLLIAEGYAHEYTYMSNPYQFQEEFLAAEKTARENGLGLWNPTACN